MKRKSEFEDKDFEDLFAYVVRFAATRRQVPSLLAGFTLSSLFFIISIVDPIVEFFWLDLLGFIFFNCFLSFMITAMTVYFSEGQAHKLKLRNIEMAEKKKRLLKVIHRLSLFDYILYLTVFSMLFSMIYAAANLLFEMYSL